MKAPPWKPVLRADWTRFLFAHYSVPADELAPRTPFDLDTRDGRAFVSLVFFRFEGMRPAGILPPAVGRLLFRPGSDAWFLNVRTYVRGPAGPGIQFLVEWMDNPIGLALGPLTYGLPYRRGRFVCPPASGREKRWRVTDAETQGTLEVTATDGAGEPGTCARGSLDEFCLERYTAYTHRRGVSRYFHIAHPHWEATRPAGLRIEGNLIRNHCPWFEHAEFVGAHTAAGFRDIAMGAPHDFLFGLGFARQLVGSDPQAEVP